MKIPHPDVFGSSPSYQGLVESDSSSFSFVSNPCSNLSSRHRHRFTHTRYTPCPCPDCAESSVSALYKTSDYLSDKVAVKERINDGVERQDYYGEEWIPGCGVYHLEKVEQTHHNERYPTEKVCSNDDGDFSLELEFSSPTGRSVCGYPAGGSGDEVLDHDVADGYKNEAEEI